MKTDTLAALNAAQADLNDAHRAVAEASSRIADLQAALAKPERFVRALEVASQGGCRYLCPNSKQSRSMAVIYDVDCTHHGIDTDELANAMRLALPMADYIRRDYRQDNSEERAALLLWIACELGLSSPVQKGSIADNAARAAGYIGADQ